MHVKKKNGKFHAILYNWEIADRIKAEFSLNKRAKRAENTPNNEEFQIIFNKKKMY